MQVKIYFLRFSITIDLFPEKVMWVGKLYYFNGQVRKIRYAFGKKQLDEQFEKIVLEIISERGDISA